MNDCPTCKGDGAHPECNGTGCADCDPTTGNCPACLGTGNDPKHWHPAHQQQTRVNEAAQILSASHREVTRNDYGSPIVAGFSVTGGLEGSARISHTTPDPDLLDPERPSDDELAAARHRMVNAYAKTLEAAGYTVERRGPDSRKPYLLASR